MTENAIDVQTKVKYVNESLEDEEDFHFLRFEALQRLNIVNLEIELTQLKSQMLDQQIGDAQDFERLRMKLSQYTTAIRDYQYLQDKQPLSKDLARTRKLRLHKYFYSGASFFDPWSSHYSYFQDQQHHRHGGAVDPLRQVLMRHLPSRLTFSRHERLARAKEYDDGLPPRDVSRFVDGLARFVVALAGGVFLVVPMVVMIIAPSETKSVVTVAVAVLVFALILSFGIKVSNVETLVSTATYAAVLVVFVGTSSEGNGGS